jgi:pectate lyase
MDANLLAKLKPWMGYASATTGGLGGKVRDVTSGDQWQALIEEDDETPDAPVIYNIISTVSGDNTKGKEITLKERLNFSITSPGNLLAITGVGVHVTRSSNVAIYNVKAGLVSEGPKDAFGFETECADILFAFNEVFGDMAKSKDFYDGLMDTKRNTRRVAIIGNYFHDHHKVSLHGYSDSDAKDREVTYALNMHRNVGSRVPLVRGGFAHVAYNVYDGVTESAVNLRMGCQALVEGNTFRNTDNPIVGIDSSSPGKWQLRANLFGSGVAWPTKIDPKKEASAQDGKSTTDFEPEYSPSFPTLDPILAAEWVEANAGLVPPGKVVTLPRQGAPIPQPEQPAEPVTPPQPSQPEQPAEEDPEVVDLGPIAVALDEAEAALAKVRRLLGAG